MGYPDGGVCQNHAQFRDVLLLGTALRDFSEPPSSASLLELSRAINASSPNLTSDVFSFIPVSFDAFLKMSSSMFNVVLICLNMHDRCIYVNDSSVADRGRGTIFHGRDESYALRLPRFIFTIGAL